MDQTGWKPVEWNHPSKPTPKGQKIYATNGVRVWEIWGTGHPIGEYATSVLAWALRREPVPPPPDILPELGNVIQTSNRKTRGPVTLPEWPGPKRLSYPEHEKLAKVSGKSQAIGEFIEWLQERGIGFHKDNEIWNLNITKELADFFDINLDNLNAEKEQMLNVVRSNRKGDQDNGM